MIFPILTACGGGGGGGGSQATVTPPEPTISWSANSLNVPKNHGAKTIMVTLNQEVTADTRFEIAVTEGSDVSYGSNRDDDYTTSPAVDRADTNNLFIPVTIAADSMSADITITPTNDDIMELDKTVSLLLPENANGFARASDQPLQVNLQDAITRIIAWNNNAFEVREGASVSFEMVLVKDGATDHPLTGLYDENDIVSAHGRLTVNVTQSGGIILPNNVDNPDTVTFAIGEERKSFTVTPTVTIVDEGLRVTRFIITISGNTPDGYRLNTNAELILTVRDPLP